MIKNKLYPYIEEYINNYLWGFTKEQLQIGILNGIISLENLYLRPDIVNIELDKLEIPFWLKTGKIGKIKVGCSLMNFIGEKPLEITIEDVNLILFPSYKYLFKNKRKTPLDSELKKNYDPIEFNSNNIFQKKVKIYDGSILNATTKYQVYQDKTELSKVINHILTLCSKFYLMKSYAINGTIHNIHIKFEDDEITNHSKDVIALGMLINDIKLSCVVEGLIKKNSFTLEGFKIYYETKPSIFIPTQLYIEAVNNAGLILQDTFYNKCCRIDFKRKVRELKAQYLIELPIINGTIGINSINQNTKVDLFTNPTMKNLSVYFSITLENSLTISIIPEAVQVLNTITTFMTNYKTLKYLTDFKPLYSPFCMNKSVQAYFLKEDPNYKNKKKKIVRDWLFYIFWFKQFKNVIQSKTSHNKRNKQFQDAFNRYMNICVFHNIEPIFKQLGEDIQIIQYTDDIKTYCLNMADGNNKKDNKDNENMNKSSFEFINLNASIQVKQIQLYIYSNRMNVNRNSFQFCSMVINGSNLNCSISRDLFDFAFKFNSFKIETEETYTSTNNEVPKHEDIINKRTVLKRDSRPSIHFHSNSINYTTATRLGHYDPLGSKIAPKHNTTIFMTAGLKVSPMIEDSKVINQMNIKVFQQQAKSAKRMKILCDTLHIGKNHKLAIHPSIIAPSEKKRAQSFSETLLDSLNEGNQNVIQLTKEESRMQTEASISKAINDYNNKKIKLLNKSLNNSINLNYSMNANLEDGKNNQSGNNIQSILNNNGNNENRKSIFSIINNKVSQLKDNFFLSLLTITMNKSKEYACNVSLKKKNCSRTPDKFSVKLGSCRINVFSSYLKVLFNILDSYKLNCLFEKQDPLLKRNDQSNEMLDKRYFFLMKKYIYSKCLQNTKKEQTDIRLKYYTYIKDNCLMPFFNEDDDMTQEAFDLAYFFTHYFSEGIQLDFNYDQIDVLYYNRDQNKNDLLARAKIPSINFKLELTLSNIFVQLYDFEFEIHDYDSLSESIDDIIDTFKGKFIKARKVIEPAIKIARELIKKEKEDALNTTINLSVIKEDASLVYLKTLSISNHVPVHIKVLKPNDTMLKQNKSTFDTSFYHNRPVTINNPHPSSLYNHNNFPKNDNDTSLLISKIDPEDDVIPKNTIY